MTCCLTGDGVQDVGGDGGGVSGGSRGLLLLLLGTSYAFDRFIDRSSFFTPLNIFFLSGQLSARNVFTWLTIKL